MKRLTFLAIFIAMVLNASAQYHMHLWIDGVKTSYPVLNLDSITFTNETPEEPETPAGDGTKANPFTVEEVIALNNTLSGKQYVKAYIVGQVNGAVLTTGAEFKAPFTPSTNSSTGVQNTYNTNLLIASSANETDPTKCVPVQLPSGNVRTNFNLPENPEMDGKLVLLNGDLIKYFGVPGIKNTVSIVVLEEGGDTPETPVEPEEPKEPNNFITCAEAVAICETTGTTLTAESYIIHGYVTEIKTAYSSQYNNITFWLADTQDGGRVLQCYRVKPVNAGEKNVKVGDYVEVEGRLINYNGSSPQVNAGGTYTIITAPIKEDTQEYVDLGLSVKWATCNVGATKPEEYGDYFAWGETKPKTSYDRDTYKWYYWNVDEYSLTKYCTKSIYGTVDGNIELEEEDDAAFMNWGGSWRMPTKKELDELREQCSWTIMVQNGVEGYEVTSRKNGNSIFLPAAGYCEGSSRFTGGFGEYWSSSLYTFQDAAWSLYFELRFGGVEEESYDSRYLGLPVRPVCP